ncbi:MAG: SMI1/KNR4 family protein [Candidatus Methylumidiphilus sp.]
MNISIMFKIPEVMLNYWKGQAEPKATTFDIMRIESAIGLKLPTAYTDFVTQFGFVIFDDVPGMRCLFDYIISFPDRKEIHEGDVGFFLEPERVLSTYEILTTKQFEIDDEFPKFPTKYLPVGNDAGQGKILLELGEHAGRVWYWPFNEWAWGVEHNTWLGFVAEDFYDFINRLRS